MSATTSLPPVKESASAVGSSTGKTVAQSRLIDVSIVIVTWNSERWIERCLAALPDACGRLSFEILVFDNASSDGTAAMAEGSSSLGLHVLRAANNRGFAGGMNEAIRSARGRYVLSLNPDCELGPGAVESLVRYADAQPTVAAVAPLLHDPAGAPQREFQLRRFPTLRILAAELLLLDKILPGNRDIAWYRYRDLDISHSQAIEQPAAAALLLRRSVLEELGGFDERFTPAWFEDVDYCRRVWEAGHEIHLLPAARATHRGGASLDHVSFEEFVSIWYRNLSRYAAKWLKPSEAEILRWLIIVGMALRIGATVVGLSRTKVDRTSEIRGYHNVMKRAYSRWDDPSQSS